MAHSKEEELRKAAIDLVAMLRSSINGPAPNKKMYSVICFDKDEKVEVAPTSWFQEGTCRWPPYKSQGVQRAIKQLEEAQSTWPVHTDGRIFYSSDSILECRKQVSLALEQTDYTSEADDQDMRPKRKLKPSRYNRDQEEEENLSPPKRKTVSHPKPPAIPRPPSNSRRFILMPNTECGFVEVPSSIEEPQNSQHVMNLGSTLRQAIEQHYGDMAGSEQQQSSSIIVTAAQPVSPPYHGYMRGCNQMCGTLLKEVLINQQILMDQQKNIIRMIQDLQRSNSGVTGIPITSSHMTIFPLSDKPALYKLEKDLANQPDLRKELVITLGLAGGGNSKRNCVAHFKTGHQK
ncbi:uncharacterized protein LOC118558814 [Fundulus heteroclitus]|uniref:uncharacterized protein LOC118558814 n=1 Tax=Fundulus heteroclitus TaxID=8078 RepID=UPI00165C0230|nr:uncharacterized protein LOC118558814 [Fundulus heteroclitus]XP_035985274.1 uncharacterized protein LOC118558814 [Fundulus heteroclitus]